MAEVLAGALVEAVLVPGELPGEVFAGVAAGVVPPGLGAGLAAAAWLAVGDVVGDVVGEAIEGAVVAGAAAAVLAGLAVARQFWRRCGWLDFGASRRHGSLGGGVAGRAQGAGWRWRRRWSPPRLPAVTVTRHGGQRQHRTPAPRSGWWRAGLALRHGQHRRLAAASRAARRSPGRTSAELSGVTVGFSSHQACAAGIRTAASRTKGTMALSLACMRGEAGRRPAVGSRSGSPY
ncbi:hypothetical protein [Roseateles sp.]|uniref:hypothetical protein n=1 Tax=Roseateles sp. TaxID=1971397 RepID=UPI003938C6E1